MSYSWLCLDICREKFGRGFLMSIPLIKGEKQTHLAFVILTAPDLFEKAALFQVEHEAVVVDLFRLFSHRAAALTGELDGFGDRFAGHDHRPVEDVPRVG